MTEELTVLDYVKALLHPWRGAPPPIPPLNETADPLSSDLIEIRESSTEEDRTAAFSSRSRLVGLSWRPALALLFAVTGQLSFEPPDRQWVQGLVLYGLGVIFFLWHTLKTEDGWVPFHWEAGKEDEPIPSEPIFWYKPNAAIVGGLTLILAFIFFGGNQFTFFNIIVWFTGIAITIYAFWQRKSGVSLESPSIGSRIKFWLTNPEIRVHITPQRLLLLFVFVVVFFFRFYDLNGVPPEMFSDHAEKLLDVYDVLHGNYQIFFPRNTGREAVQMYLTAGVIQFLGTGYSFLSLKIGTALLGFLTLIYIYLITRDYANRRAAFFAVFFAGISYWPNVIARVALRFTLTPFFVAPTLYYLLRGYRRRSLNDFILSGIFLGLGLNGYSTMRIVPFLIVTALLIYLVHKQSKGWRKQAVYGLLILAFFSLIIFLPLLRYVMENPQMFSYRALTRLGTIERPLPGPIWQVFLDNFWKASTMFFWNNGEIWVHSIPNRPALDFITAAIFLLGVLFFIIRYLRSRDWSTLFLLVSIPMLMLPSTLSLAFPGENPSLNRTGGAIIPVFLIVGVVVDALLTSFQKKQVDEPASNQAEARPLKPSATLSLPVLFGLAFLMLISAFQNYNLVFHQYRDMFAQSAWNTSELGRVVHGFTESIGTEDQTWVIAYPHWVDTRLVGMVAGFPTRDFGIWPQDLKSTLASPTPKLFLVKPDDKEGLSALVNIYPEGFLQLFHSKIKEKDFYIFTVPASKGSQPAPDSGK